MSERDVWYAAHNCAHAHCPHQCEKPQSFMDDDTGELLCGCCWFKFGERSVMVPCTPDICD